MSFMWGDTLLRVGESSGIVFHSGQQEDSEEEFWAETWSVCASRTRAGQGKVLFLKLFAQ